MKQRGFVSLFFAAPCSFLVCHGRSRLLHQPWAGLEDEPVGQVKGLVLGTHTALRGPGSPVCGLGWGNAVDQRSLGSACSRRSDSFVDFMGSIPASCGWKCTLVHLTVLTWPRN